MDYINLVMFGLMIKLFWKNAKIILNISPFLKVSVCLGNDKVVYSGRNVINER